MIIEILINKNHSFLLSPVTCVASIDDLSFAFCFDWFIEIAIYYLIEGYKKPRYIDLVRNLRVKN